MTSLCFDTASKEPLNILCLGAHCDDIEIGCGGTLLKLAAQNKIGRLRWIVFASNAKRKEEAIQSARLFTANIPDRHIEVLEYRDAFLNFSALEIKEYFETTRKAFEPDVVFTHYRDDRHQDHRLLSDLAWNTFRHHLILEYEIPKYDGDLGQPNCYFHLSGPIAKQKSAILLESFASQAGKHWFDEETFLSLMRIRGIESACPSRYAEAFYARKLVF